MNAIHRRSSRVAIGAILAALLSSPAVAQTLPDLFQKLKSEVNARAWTEASRTLAALQAEAVKPGNEASLAKLEGPIAFYRGVCEANLGQTNEAIEDFATFLKIQPNATIDSAVYSKEAVAAFEEARKVVAERAPSLAAAYREFEPPADRNGKDDPDKFWANGPIQWILTDEEKAEWSRLTEPNARVDFVDRFWASRATLPGSGDRSFRQEFERRVAFADAYLAQDREQRGSLTDRGMVFILLGPPTHARRRALRSGEDPSDPSGESRVETQEAKLALKPGGMTKTGKGSGKNEAVTLNLFQGAEHRATSMDDEFSEVWNYTVDQLPRGVRYKQLDVHYVTKKGGGKNVLQPSTSTQTTLASAKRAAAPASRP
jgi:GWxTD domain-containing protein